MDLVIYLLPILDIYTRDKRHRPALCKTVELRKLDFTSIQPRLILSLSKALDPTDPIAKAFSITLIKTIFI